MKKFYNYLAFIAIFGIIIAFSQCNDNDDDDSIIEDVDKLTALKNVEFTYDSMSYAIGLPDSALESGKTFDELVAEDSAKYTNPENYSVTFVANMLADNTKEDARDAKFDGMDVNIILDTNDQSPIETKADEFEVKKNETKPVTAKDSINLKTHRVPGLYFFQQVVDGEDLATTLFPVLKYSIGSENGTIEVPQIQEDVPTRASDDMKVFLQGLLDSGVFDEPVEKK